MNTTKKQRNFSMKYCHELEDHVVVMTTVQGDCKNRVCLSSHLCPTEQKASCGQETPIFSNENVFSAEVSFKTEKKHFL